jgi:glycosyltransferase involved in cell wall biosynthesis
MMTKSKSDFELVIKTQTDLKVKAKDSRITIDTDNIKNRQDLYSGYDAMILPRRYAGLCLPMNEALISGLPVFMTDISPNNIVLPSRWLIPSEKIGSFQTKSMVDIYTPNLDKFARIIDDYVENSNKTKSKQQAVELGFNHFSVENLKDKYLEVING